jgi:CTP:molybdopterin cytidylyltransferase MocA
MAGWEAAGLSCSDANGRKGYSRVKTAVLIFEGGPAATNELQETMTGLRHAVTLDTVEKFLAAPGVHGVTLATNHLQLARAAGRLGARIFDTRTRGRFHFGQALQQAVSELDAEHVIYLGGASVPLIKPGEIAWIVKALEDQAPCVVVNNPQSADLIAFTPANALRQVAPPSADNFLGWQLREAGLQRILIPNSASVHFDLDTPADYLILAQAGQAGRRATAALRAIGWDRSRIEALQNLLAGELKELALVGRVGTAVVEHINIHLRCRLRIFSEERGMKALGREEAGLVTSFLGDLVNALGPERFFRMLSGICDGIVLDSRVMMANGGRRVSEWDRFHSDLGMPERIRDPWVRALTEAALACRVPVVMGGHSVVSGGLWLLADLAVAERDGGLPPS